MLILQLLLLVLLRIIIDFAVLADDSVKMKESEKMNKYVDLPRELKKLWNGKVTVIAMIVAAT